MTMELKITGRFKKDLKKYKHDKEKLEALEEVLTHLRESGVVPDKYKPHPLIGEYTGCIECHVKK